MIRREADAIARKQRFLLIRYGLILATGALSFLELGKDASPVPLAVLILVAVASNLVMATVPAFRFFDARTQAPVLVGDTVMISFALLFTRASQESFLFFFFVLIMAAKVENFVLLGAGAALIGVASFLVTDMGPSLVSPSLMRIPFLLATGIFFGYVVLPERTGQMVPLGRQASAAARLRHVA